MSFDKKSHTTKDRLILCIDNEQSILDGMQSLLQSWGFSHSITSLDGDFSQYRNYKAENVALILADYHLADEKTGVDAINQIRAMAKWDVPAVVITADQSEKVKKHIQENGNFLLHKPIKPLPLKTLLNRLMRH